MSGQTLILEIALPDFFCDDYAPGGELWGVLQDFADEGEELTPERLAEIALDDSGLTTPRINLSILLGDKGGDSLERVKGQLVGARIVPREPSHELTDDDRLDYHEGEPA